MQRFLVCALWVLVIGLWAFAGRAQAAMGHDTTGMDPVPGPSQGIPASATKSPAVLRLHVPDRPTAMRRPGELYALRFGEPNAEHPDALVYLPTGYVPTRNPAIILYLHGYENCIETIVRSENRPCTEGGQPRNSHALLSRFDEAGKNAIAILPELAFDERSGNPGSLAEPQAFRRLVEASLRHLRFRLGIRPQATPSRVVVIAHSAGYEAASALLQRGGLRVDEVYLLDALYGEVGTFEGWVKGSAPGVRRLVNLYTKEGGTRKLSRELGKRLVRWGTRRHVLDDRRPSGFPVGAFKRRVIVKMTGVSHNDIPRVFVGDLLRASVLPDLPPLRQRPRPQVAMPSVVRPPMPAIPAIPRIRPLPLPARRGQTAMIPKP